MRYLILLLICLAAAEQSYDRALAAKSIYLSSAIYNITKEDQSNNKCPDCYPGFKVLSQVLGNNILAVVGVDAALKSIVVVVRGSDNLNNFLTDAMIRKIDYEEDLCRKCELHGGFLRSYRKLTKEGLEKAIANAISLYPKYGLLFTGHSLGGAVAVIAAVKVAEQYSGKDIKLYTFGQPRVGDGDYANYADSKVSHFFRLIHKKDIVPHKPAYIAFYRHSGYEIWYKDGMNGDYLGCKGDSDYCSNSIGSRTTSFSTKDHSSLNYIELDDHSGEQPQEATESAFLFNAKGDEIEEALLAKEQASVVNEDHFERHSDLFDGDEEQL